MAISRSNSLEPIYGILEQLQVDDLICFTDIEVIGPDGMTRLLDNVCCKIQTRKTLLNVVNEQLRIDSIESSMLELNLGLYTKNITLNKQSLTKHLIEYFHRPNFNNLFEKKISMFELQNGTLIPYKFSEDDEIKKGDGFVQNKLTTTWMLKQGIDPAEANSEDYYDTNIVISVKPLPARIYFDQFQLNESAEEWFMFAEFKNRTLVIPVTEFFKERNICPSMMCEYLGYLKKNKPRDFRKYNNILVDSELNPFISKGWLNFFENVSQYHLSGLYYTLITGTTKGVDNIINCNTVQLESEEWSKLIDFNSFTTYSNYNPVWFASDSILYLKSHEIKHKIFI
jgi:hypothetical protein